MASISRVLLVLGFAIAPLGVAAQSQAPSQLNAALTELVRLEKQAQACGLGRGAPEFDTFTANQMSYATEYGATDGFLELLCLKLGCAEDNNRIRPALSVAKPADCAAFLQRFRAMRMTRKDWKPAEGIR